MIGIFKQFEPCPAHRITCSSAEQIGAKFAGTSDSRQVIPARMGR